MCKTTFSNINNYVCNYYADINKDNIKFNNNCIEQFLNASFLEILLNKRKNLLIFKPTTIFDINKYEIDKETRILKDTENICSFIFQYLKVSNNKTIHIHLNLSNGCGLMMNLKDKKNIKIF